MWFFRYRAPGEGDTWNLQEAAAFVTFCPGAITKPLLITCSIWNPNAFSPPLGSDEALVSNVIELSHDGPPNLDFSGDAQGNVTVALMHSASNFRGYEVVIKQLVDPENNEWIDLVTNNFLHTSGIALEQVLAWFVQSKNKSEKHLGQRKKHLHRENKWNVVLIQKGKLIFQLYTLR